MASTTPIPCRPGVPATEFYLSTLVAPDTDVVSHGGPHGARVSHVLACTSTASTSNDPVYVSHLRGADDLTNDTVTLRYDTSPGGDITGAIVFVRVEFMDSASGGIS